MPKPKRELTGRSTAPLLIAAALCALAIGPRWSSAMSVRPRVSLELGNASQGQLRFYAQSVCYRGGTDKQRLELSYAMGFDQLQFLGDSTGYRGGFTLSVIAFDRQGNQMAGDSWERRISARDYPSTQRHDSIISGSVDLNLAPGQYRLVVSCNDANSQRSGTLDVSAIVPSFSGACTFSGIALLRAAHGDTLPWPLARYGDIAAPLIAECEVYCQRPGSYELAVALWSLDDRRTVWQRRQRQVLDQRTTLRLAVPADSIVSGSYELQLTITDDSGAMAGQARCNVIIDNATLLTESDYQYKIDQLRYLARNRELDSLKKATGGQRDSLWVKFWRDRDPTPGTDRNEARDEYYGRVQYANQHYTSGIKPGWRTDMGQIYIRYGPPDDIERHPFDPDVPAYEVWYYYASNRKFIFNDLQGFGEYRLTYPTNERMR